MFGDEDHDRRPMEADPPSLGSSAVLDAHPDGICVMDGEGRVTAVNRSFERMASKTRAELMGTVAPFAWWDDAERGEIVAELCAQLASGHARHDFEVTREDGLSVPVSLELAPLGAGPGTGVLAIVRDLSSEVNERIRRLDAEGMAGLSTWEWDPKTDRISGSTGLLTAAGIDPRECGTMTSFLRFVPDPDREAVGATMRAFATGAKDECVFEHRLRGGSPEVEWMQVRARSVRDREGAVVRVQGVTQDVSDQRRVAEELRQSHELSEMAERIAQVGSFEVEDGSGRVRWSGNLYRLFGVDPAAEGDRQEIAFQMIHDDDLAAFQSVRAQVRAEGTARSLDHRYRRGEELLWAETRFEPLLRDGVIIGVRGTLQDITDRRRGEREARLQAHLVDAVDAAVIATGLDGRITHWNSRAEALYGWTAEEAIGERTTMLKVTPEETSETRAIAATIEATGAWSGSFEVRHKDGRAFTVLVHVSVYADEEGARSGLIGTSMDISERVDLEETTAAARDYLLAVTDSIGEGVMTLDETDRLIYMNPAAQNMLGWRPEELGDEALDDIMQGDHQDGADPGNGDCQILRARSERRTIRVDHDVFVNRDGTEIPVEYVASPIEIDGGMNGCVVVFDDISARLAHGREIDERIASLSWIGRIHDALKRDLFVVHAQPILDLQTGAVAQYELLIRMVDGDGSLIPPGRFLPVAEEFEVMGEIDRWMTAQAVQIAARGHCVHLNLSAQSMGSPTEIATLRESLEATGAHAGNVVIELTETAMMANEDVAKQFAHELRSIGCRLALDDFGTGFGGFSYLKQLPVDYLKIDQEFVSDLVENAASRHVVTAVVSLAGAFGQKTIAEGVEDADVLAVLRELGVDYAQGFHIARPAPVAEVLPVEQLQ